jgi:hypothetical protein
MSAEAIAIREAEVAEYDRNIAIYESILANLPAVWPAHLEAFKGRFDQHQAITECAAADVDTLAQLLYRQQLEATIRTERLERTKAAAILAALKA